MWNFFLSTLLLSHFAWAQAPLPITYDITPLLERGAVTLSNGARIALDRALASGERLLFEDLLPRANWSHPANLSLVTPSGEKTWERRVSFPPRGLKAKLRVGEDFPPPLDVTFELQDWEGKWRVARPERFHAVLINGLGDLRHWNDFSFLYRTLTRVYGYRPSQIHVMDSHFKDEKPDLNGDGTIDILYLSTVSAVRALFAKLAEDLQPDDRLLLVVNDHGGLVEGEATFMLTDGEIKASAFAQLLSGLRVGRLLEDIPNLAEL